MLLEEKWKKYGVTINDVAFVYPLNDLRHERPECGTPPISWLMTDAENACVTHAWKFAAPQIAQFTRIENDAKRSGGRVEHSEGTPAADPEAPASASIQGAPPHE